MIRTLSALLVSVFLLPAAGVAGELPSERLNLPQLSAAEALAVPALDSAKALAEDQQSQGKSVPLRYAIGASAKRELALVGKGAFGRWDTLPDGRMLWRAAISAPNALGVELEFSAFFLPHGAELYLAGTQDKSALAPFTDRDNTSSGQFWTPLVPGAGARLELIVPARAQGLVKLKLERVASAYRDVYALVAADPKSLPCNIDVACSAADGLRDPVRAVAGYGFDSQANRVLCTGQLLNNARRDSRRFVLTANHCIDNTASAASMVMYWKYQSPTCRTPGSPASGTPIALSTAIAQTGGALLRATFDGSDMTLVELNTAIPAGVDPFFLGWDRRDAVPSASAIIHHSNGDEKRISRDFDPPTVNPAAVGIDTIAYLPGASVDVTYDLSTTEGGASGGALLTPEGRVIGQLGGGPAGSCTVGITDTYGRFFSSWAGGGTDSSRLSNWLDPDNSGTQILDGTNPCTAPTVTLTGPAAGQAGQALTFSVSATGIAPFTLNWDLDNDGVTDRSIPGLAASTASSIAPSYPTATTTNVVARVVDATGCTGVAQRALNVSAPDIVATAQAPQQLCGDGDAQIEPGEGWRIPVRVENFGGQALNSGYAIFAPASSTSAANDGFGYRIKDSGSDNFTCPFQFVDLSGVLPALALTASGAAAPANDDGHTASLNLGTSPFNFYGQAVNSVVMSTNGYLSTSASDSGGDYDNTCALAAPDRGSSGGRINALHQDLVINSGGGLRSQHFSNCPRAANSGGAAVGCTVFQWTDMAQFQSGGGALGSADFEAILYDQTYEIVYQYRAADPTAGGNATIGIQNAAATDRAQYSCNQAGQAPANRAVCLFHPTSLPSSAQLASVRLDTPAVALPNLGSGQNQTANVDFVVPTTTACGSALNLKYVGTVDTVAYSMRGADVVNTVIGGGLTCQTAQACNITPPATIAAIDGLYANFSRFGNGIGSFNIPNGGGGTVYFGTWFTGERGRSPTWYIVQGDRLGNQAIAPLYRFRQTSATPFASSGQVVGSSQVTYVANDRYVFTWNLDGIAAGEQQAVLYPGTRPTPNRTGAWFYPPESGWGYIAQDYGTGAEAHQTIINFIFGGDNNPRWTLGDATVVGNGQMPQTTYRVQCPTCPYLADFLGFPLNAGSLVRAYTTVGQGTLSTSITFPAPLSGTWNRNALPVQLLTAPAPQ